MEGEKPIKRKIFGALAWVTIFLIGTLATVVILLLIPTSHVHILAVPNATGIIVAEHVDIPTVSDVEVNFTTFQERARGLIYVVPLIRSAPVVPVPHLKLELYALANGTLWESSIEFNEAVTGYSITTNRTMIIVKTCWLEACRGV